MHTRCLTPEVASGRLRRLVVVCLVVLVVASAAPVARAGDPSDLRCFGAAARDLLHPCVNAALRLLAFPRPDEAYTWENAACVRRRDAWRTATFDPCTFGVTDGDERATVALIGDSHAIHWRGALEVVADAHRWRALTIARAGCPFSVQIPSSPALGPGACAQLHRETLAWLRAHRRVRTIFVSDWAQPPWGPMGGTDAYGGSAGAFRAMLGRVPRTVRRIYVLRDIPATRVSTPDCVATLRRLHRPLARACSVPRSTFLVPDPGAAAARGRSRVRVLDMTRFFCGPRRCFPVVGGAYVYKDDNHMNALFAETLGRPLLDAMKRAG